jgi:hypothetical protein
VNIELDHETHAYTLGGQPIGGVSEILGSLGIVDRSWFTDWARDRGKAVHTAIEFHMTGGLDWKTVDPRIKGYVEAALRFMDDAKIKPGPGTYVERPIAHPHWRYCGTPDLVCEAFGDQSVPDFKSGGLGAAGIQTALYEMAARVAYPVVNLMQRRRMGIQLFEDGHYKKTDLRDGFDYADAHAAIAIFNKFHLPRKQRGAAYAA